MRTELAAVGTPMSRPIWDARAAARLGDSCVPLPPPEHPLMAAAKTAGFKEDNSLCWAAMAAK